MDISLQKKKLHNLLMSSSSSTSEKDGTRPCLSLPLFNERTDLCALGIGPGMECMPLRSPPGPYHYHVADQTKSLQELQNEVGALLEFRDLVIETFPDLKNKMASTTTSSTITGMPSSSLASRRAEWEPGIRVRRKLTQKENTEISPSSLIRSRSNSHSGKKEPKSGEGNGSVVQDSGFSTETSSSKETHSASSTTGAVQGTNVSNNTQRLGIDCENELWNLLDVIHRKSNRLREEVEQLQHLEKGRCKTNSIPINFQKHLDKVGKEDVQILRKERDRLLDKLSEMEAETLSGRIKATNMQDEIEQLVLAKKELEEQLKAALSQKIELNSRIHELHQQFVNRSAPTSPESMVKSRILIAPGARKISSDSTTLQSPQGASPAVAAAAIAITLGNRSNTTAFTPVVVHHSSTGDLFDGKSNFYQPNPAINIDGNKLRKNEHNLGRLDGLVSTPNRINKIRLVDSKKIAAILLETDVVELQRHLLTLTVQNQVLQQKLDHATRSKLFLINRLDKAKEDIDDLKFQLEEKNIEFEGTRAQLRVLESKSTGQNLSLSKESTMRLQSQISTPSMKAMIPLAMDEILQHSSSTESAHDQTEHNRTLLETPKKRPSRIPLPGTKGYSAPKPPTGRSSINYGKGSPSGPSSNKSLNKSTSSLLGRSTGPSSVKKDNYSSPNLNRPESAQSWRKDSSLSGNTSKSSSIPISSKIAITTTATVSTPTTTTTVSLKPNFSPIPKYKRDSLNSKARNLDSLSRSQTSTPSTTPTNSNLYKSMSKKDLSSSFSNGQTRTDRNKSSVPIRRVSSASIGRNLDVQQHQQQQQQQQQQSDTDNGKRFGEMIKSSSAFELSEREDLSPRGTSSIRSRDLIREYLSRIRCPPAIFKTPFENTFINSTTTTAVSSNGNLDLAYKHPLLLTDEDDDDDYIDGSIYNEKNREVEIKYIDNNYSIELLNSQTNSENENNSIINSIIIPQFVNNNNHMNEDLGSDDCRLIGKVNPNILKTWEQLSGQKKKNLATTITSSSVSASQTLSSGATTTATLSSNATSTSDQQSYTLFYRKPFHFTGSDKLSEGSSTDKYRVNKMIHSESSGDFYDSIDDGNPVIDKISLICQEVNDNDIINDAGEGMAEFDSLDKNHFCWSIESHR